MIYYYNKKRIELNTPHVNNRASKKNIATLVDEKKTAAAISSFTSWPSYLYYIQFSYLLSIVGKS